MSDTAWETLSNQAVAICGVLYFLAVLAYLVQWSALRRLPAEAAVAVGAGGAVEAEGLEAATDVEESQRMPSFFGRLGLILTAMACAVHLVALVGRGMAADPNRVPWGNMYEFAISGTFFMTLGFLLAYRRLGLAWMGPIVSGFVVTVLMFAVIWLHDPVAPLSEALNSPWLVIHVVSAVIATGVFTLGGVASILYLIKVRVAARGGERAGGYLSRVPEPAVLDRVAYRLHAFAFPVWTFAVLITGPIWAHEAWAAYWSWDPKEVWAFITWVVYAAYLHARATAGWKGRKAAIIALVGLGTLWFSFVGVNYFISSQHSYAKSSAEISQVVEASSLAG